MGISSANPDHLDAYVRAAQAMNEVLKRRLGSLAQVYNQVVPRLRWGVFDASETLADLATFIRLNDADDQWVATIAAAFREADASGGVVTVGDGWIDAALDAAGVAQGPRAHITVDDPIVAGMPPTSGFASDPVSTASGHFVEVEVDLPLPARAGPLGWVRTYNSRWRREGPFGRGWSSWASVRAERRDDASVEVFFPDGRRAVFARRGEGGFERVGGVAGGLADHEGGLALEWFNAERWLFDPDGQVVGWQAAGGGQARFEWDGGRLVAVRHSVGRWVELGWEGERIVALASSDGRQVTYRYDQAGDLIEAITPNSGGRRYEMADGGLLAGLVDADGVEVVRNAYDEDGRVLTQRSPFGRLTRFRYTPPGITVVDDDAGGPTTTYLHDPAGRLIGVVDDHGARMTKTYDQWGNPIAVSDRLGNTTVQIFDERGRLLHREEPDGSATIYRWDDHDRIAARSDPLGNTVRLFYEDEDRVPSQTVDALGAITRLEVVDGLIQALTDPDGVVTRFDYDIDGLLVGVIEAGGRTTNVERDATGEVTALRGPSGELVRIDRDEAGRVAHRHLPSGGVIGYRWTLAGRLAASTSLSGTTAHMSYGEHGEIAELVDSAGATMSFRWDELGNLVGLTNPAGQKIDYGYDGLCRLTSISDPAGGTWLREYDAEGRLVGAINPEGERRTRAYDARGRVVTEADAAGHTTRYDYDAGDRLIRVIDPAGAETSFAYDALGRLTEANDALGATTRYDWSPAGRLRAVTSPLGHITRYEYDATGQMVAVVDPTGARRSVDRDASGRVVAATSPSGDRVEWDYDAAGRVVSSRGADGALTRFGYDPAGRLGEIVDPTGAAARYAYDPAGRLVQAVDPLGGVTSFSYDQAGLLHTTVDPLGGEQRLDYDSAGRMVAFTDQAGNQRRLRLDQAGRVVGQVDGAGNQVRFWRDEAGRVTGWGPQDLPEPLVSLELDPVGRPVRISEPDRMTSLSWDGLGRLVRQHSEGLALGWRYDADGRQTAVVHPDGSETTYAYDAAGRLTALAHPVAGQARIERGREGLPLRFHGPGIRRSWQRRHGRTVRFTQQTPDTSLNVGFEHDAAGRVVAETGPQGRTSYSYDPAGQLVAMNTPEGAAWTWAYDAGGRRVRESGPPGERRFRYDPAGRLLEVESEGDTVRLAYDGAGRRVGENSRRGEVAYTWDSLGRLASIHRTRGDRATATSLHTDAFGDLVQVDDTPLMWDRSRGLPVPRRAGAADIIGAWDPLAVVTQGGPSWLATDPWGSIGNADDVWGGGSGIDVSGGPRVSLGYRGELNVVGLMWLRNRAYDPATAAFLSPDPLPPVLGSPTVANPYHYAFNDPLGYVDPLGLQPLTDAQLAQMREAAARPIWDKAADSFSELVQDPGRWVSEHGDELLAAGVVVAGTIMIATGVGAPIGAGLLIGAGISMGAQVALTGEVDARQVWISGLAGGAGAGAGMLTAGRSLATQGAVGAGTDAATSTLGQLITTGHVNPTAVITDTIAGGVSSTIGARLGPSSATSVDELVAGHSIRDVNPGYPSPGRTMNCVNCAVATDATLAGRPASALPGSPTPIAALEEHFGGTFKAVASPSEVSASLHEAGPGARGIMFGYRSTGVGHVFNAVNQGGTIRLLDGQIGGPASLEGYDALYFLRTN